MGLLANLGLKAKPPAAASAASAANNADAAKADALKADISKGIKSAVALAATLPDPKAKVELARALQAADADRKKADVLRDASKRAEALKAALAKVEAATTQAKKAGSAAPPQPAPALGGDAPQAAPPVKASGGDAPADKPPAADPKAEAGKLRAALEKQQAEARAAYAKLAPEQAKLEDQIEAAKADRTRKAELADLQARKKAIEAQIAPLDRQMKYLDADTKALADPRSTAKTYNDILARQQSGAYVVPEVVIDKHDSDLEKKRTENKTTKVTTDYKDGKSTTQTDVSKTTVGAGGYTQANSSTKEVVKSDGSKTTDSTSKTSSVGKDGIAYDKSTKSETENKDGKKSGTEDKTSVQVGPGGATRTDSSTRTNEDGSSSTQSKTTGVERGEGKAGVVSNKSDSKTDASGNTTTTSSKTKGGMSAGKDGMGAYAETEKAVENKRANGLKTGAVAGLNANVVCNIVAKGGEPPKYALTVSVNLGMKLGASAGRDKEGGASGSVGVSASEAVFMNRSYMLSEEEAQAYVASLKSASAGGGGGTHKEFAIISTGVGKGWDAAREMYLAMSGKAVDKAQVDKLKTGESIEVGKKEKLGGNASAGGKSGGGVGIGVEGGYEAGHDQSMKVTKEDDGKLTYDTQDGNSDKLSGGMKVNVGAVEGGFSASHTNTTSTGYKVSVDPKDPKAAEMQNALAKCASQADLDAFAKKYPQSVKEKTKSKGSADAQGANVGIGLVKGGLNFGNSLDESVTTDGEGNFKKKVTTGGNTGGVELGIGGLKVGASKKEQAVAEVDAQGNTTLDVSKAEKSTDAAKWLEANVPLVGGKKEGGALAKATGGEEKPDTDKHDLKGIKLKGSDLGYLGHLACNDWGKWMSACPSPSMRKDWAKAGNAIKGRGGDKGAVAQELAKFVGADSGARADVVNAIVRPAGDVSGGSRYEFPGSLASQKGTYDAIVIEDSEKQVDALKADKAKADAAGTALISQLERLYASVSSASGFSQPAVQAEMLSAINNRKGKVQAALRVLKGGKADELSKEEQLKKYNDYIDNCTRYKNTETECFAKIEETFKDGGKPGLDATIENAKLIKQLRDLHALWQKDYDEMAALAQENGFGADRYWKYKPDRERFNRAVKGNPGAATEAKPETEDKRKKKEVPVKRESADPLGDSNRELQKKREETTKGIEGRLPAAKNKAYGAGTRLHAWIQTDKRPGAIDAHNRGMAKLKSADNFAKKVKPGNIEDLESYGHIAIEDYQEAAKIFAEGLLGYPGGMPKKEKKEASA